MVTLLTDSLSGDRTVHMHLEEKIPAWQWVVQSRALGAWTTTILPGDQHDHVLAGPEAQADVVSVVALNRVGNQSPPAKVGVPSR